MPLAFQRQLYDAARSVRYGVIKKYGDELAELVRVSFYGQPLLYIRFYLFPYG